MDQPIWTCQSGDHRLRELPVIGVVAAIEGMGNEIGELHQASAPRVHEERCLDERIQTAWILCRSALDCASDFDPRLERPLISTSIADENTVVGVASFPAPTQVLIEDVKQLAVGGLGGRL